MFRFQYFFSGVFISFDVHLLKCHLNLCKIYFFINSLFRSTRFPLRTILGAHTDASIDVSDPISDHFYKEIWMATCARNATIYQKVDLMFASVATVTLRRLLSPEESELRLILLSPRYSVACHPATSGTSWSWRATWPSRAWRGRTLPGLERS